MRRSFLADAGARYDLKIQPQPLGAALQEFAKQSGVQIIFFSRFTDGHDAPALSGKYTSESALNALLQGTDLTFHQIDNKTIQVEPKTNSRKSPSEPSPESSEPKQLEEVVVTGTHIRGEDPAGSPLIIYSHDDIEKSGAATVDQFARSMPENFAGADAISNTLSVTATNATFGQGATDNAFGGASFDLRGLGTTSTLTLVDGHRIAPAGTSGFITDVSQIPLSAIDHIEVLTDGASAVYGTDAIAGVVNLITRKDFEGAESGLRYGGATSGGALQFTGSQLLGHAWSTGHLLLTYEFNDQKGLDASERSYIPDQGGRYSLIPQASRNSVLFSGSQQTFADFDLTYQGSYGYRHGSQESTTVSQVENAHTRMPSQGRQYGFFAALDRDIASGWHGQVSGDFSRVEQSLVDYQSDAVGTFVTRTNILQESNSQIAEGNVLITGPLVTGPAGPIKAAVGGIFHSEKFSEQILLTTDGMSLPSPGSTVARRDLAGAFAELYIPVVQPSNGYTWARRIDLSVAVRYDHYSDFGSTTNPKFGLTWEPAQGLSFRGSYGNSFRAPLLTQTASPIMPVAVFLPDPASPTRVSSAILLSGGSPALGPEKSSAYTAGFDIKPAMLPRTTIHVTWFRIAYVHRIALPPFVGEGFLSDPTLAPLVARNPPLSTVESYFNSPFFLGDGTGAGPAAVTAIVDDRTANIAATRQEGIDFSLAHTLPTEYGDFSGSVAGTNLMRYDFQSFPGMPSISLVNTLAQPAKWKGHVTLGWALGGLTSALTANGVGSYENTSFSPPQRVSSWITLDLFIGYRTGATPDTALWRNWTLGLSVQNVANREPPVANMANLFPGQNPIPFDPTNASPIGRFISLNASKRW